MLKLLLRILGDQGLLLKQVIVLHRVYKRHDHADATQVDLFYGQMPNAVAVNKAGRVFCSYPSGLDHNNTAFQVAELTGNPTETPYPNAAINSPPGGAINYTTYEPNLRFLSLQC